MSAKVIDYTGSVVKIGGGTTSTTPGTGGSTGEGSGDKEEEKPPVTPPAPEGAVGSLTFTGTSLTPISKGITFTLTNGSKDAGGIDFYPSSGKVKVLKMENDTKVTFKTIGSETETYTCTMVTVTVVLYLLAMRGVRQKILLSQEVLVIRMLLGVQQQMKLLC